MSSAKNILVVPCSTQLGVEQFHSLRFNKHFNLIGASHNDADSLFSNFIKLRQNINSQKFIEELNNIIANYSIDIVLPSHDEINFILSKDKNISGLIPGLNDFKTIEITRFKSLTYKTLESNKLTKHLIPKHTVISNSFIKPDKGQGSRGTLNAVESHLICEFLPGAEYTIDCFNDNEGRLLYSCPRIRKTVVNGISEETEIVKEKTSFEIIAQNISRTIQIKGCWFFQLKLDNQNDLKLLEVAPRIAGGSNINRLNGVNLTALNLYQHIGLNPSIHCQNLVTITQRKQPKYNLLFDDIFVDYDDTYFHVIDKLTQTNKNIILITRSKVLLNTPYETIYVKRHEKKSEIINKIKPTKSIFIDDSFAERMDVATNSLIPAIAPEEAEYLL